MLSSLMVVVLAATEVSAAATGGLTGQKNSITESVAVPLNLRLDVTRDLDAFSVRLHASWMISGGGFPLFSVGFQDLGTSLELAWRPPSKVRELALIVLPFNVNSRLVSFDWANAWGRALNFQLSPMVLGELRMWRASGWLGVRAVRAVSGDQDHVYLDVLGGLDAELPASLRLEARAGFLQYGFQPTLAQLGRVEPMWALLGSTRLSWTWNEAVAPPVDLVTYATDPTRFDRFFAPPREEHERAATVLLEGGLGAQRLASRASFTEDNALMTVLPAGYVDLQARLRLGHTSIFGTVRVRTPSQMNFDAPGLPIGYVTTDSQYAIAEQPYVAGFVGASVQVPRLHLTPGVLLRVVSPAVLATPNLFDPAVTTRRVLLTDLNTLALLPEGVAVLPAVGGNASLAWHPHPMVSAIAQVDLFFDGNAVVFVDSTTMINEPVRRPWMLRTRWQVLLQARF